LRKGNLTILLALLPALLTTTALLTALASGLLLLLTGLLLTGLLLLLTGLLLTALLAALLLPALLNIAYFVVRHGEFSFAETFREGIIFSRLSWFP
jgi:hypothetical protein